MNFFEVIFPLTNGRGVIIGYNKIFVHKDCVVKKEQHRIEYVYDGGLYTITHCIIK